MFAFRHQFAQHYTNISLTKYIYISYETLCAFIFTWATLQTRRVWFPSPLPSYCLDWPSRLPLYVSTCVEYGSIKWWQLKRKEGCEMVGGYIPPVLHSFLYNFEVLNKTKIKIEAPQSSTISESHVDRLLVKWSPVMMFGCNNKATVISNLDISCICTLLFHPNSYSGLSYSLNTGSLKAENSLNWLV